MKTTKKNFKDNTANIDRFFSTSDTSDTDVTHITHDTDLTHTTSITHDTHLTHDTHKKYYRINLNLRPQFRQYLDDEAWKSRKSVTEYLNDLIQADMDKKK